MQTSGGTVTAEPERWNTIEELCDRYLGGRPSEATLQLLRNAEQQRPEVRDFVERAFRLMAISKFDPRDLSPFVARFFHCDSRPGILPGAWGGMVPPFTLAGRHKKIDAYLRSSQWANFEPGSSCWMWDAGFLLRLPSKQPRLFLTGKSLAWTRLLNNISCTTNARTTRVSTGTGSVRYFQASPPGRISPLVLRSGCNDSEFFAGVRATAPNLPPDDGTLSTTEQGGRRLVRHPMSTYERSNLRFVQGGFGSSGLPEAGIVRSFNVLIYYDADFRRQAEEWVARTLRPGGLFICGRDDCGIAECTLFGVSQRGRPAGGKGICIRRGNRASLRLVHPARRRARNLAARGTFGNPAVRPGISARLRRPPRCSAGRKQDCHSRCNGHLAEPPNPIDPARGYAGLRSIVRDIEAEFADRAVSVLQRAGLNAWRNPVGHIAVGPSQP